MEYFKPSFTAIFFLFLLLAPHLSRGKSSDHDHHVDGEIYEIDYRGPETHSSIPPPDHTHTKPLIHRESTSNCPKSKAREFGRKVKKIHG